MVDFLFALIEHFSLSITVPEYKAKCAQLGCFRRGLTSLHLNFTWTGSFSSNHSWQQKTRDTGLPNGKDRIALRSLVLTQYRSVTDGQKDRWTDGFAVAYTALAASCKNA